MKSTNDIGLYRNNMVYLKLNRVHPTKFFSFQVNIFDLLYIGPFR